MPDEDLPLQGPPFESAWPPEGPDDPQRPRRPIPRWGKWFGGVAIVLIAIAVAGSVIRVPYSTLSPGGTLDLATRVSVRGAKTYPDRGDVMLLFVRERTHINLWRWVQAKLDPNIDLLKQSDLTGGTSLKFANEQDVCDMAQSQVAARVAALGALGYHVPVLPGLDIAGMDPTLPAYQVLQPCDEIVSADGRKLTHPGDLSKIVKAHRVGTTVSLGIIRGGKAQSERVAVAAAFGTRVIGVDLALRYRIPLHIDINTSDISGPSAGLAITLAIIDALTPGELTGGKRVAVTGTIDPQGNVGEIGGLPQKAVAARAAHAQIFIVPVCLNDSRKAGCLADLATARKRVGKSVELAPVSTLAQALTVLREAGGAPVPAPSTT